MTTFFAALWKKILRGSTPERRSRFHTQDGRLPPARAWLNFPRSLLQWFQLKAYGRRPELPWIPYSATRALQRHLCAQARVLEIGAGMSTLWLARHCGKILSIEADQAWFRQLTGILATRGYTHVELQYRWQREDMCDFYSIPDGSLDLAFVDAGPRLKCLQAALPKLKLGGWLYVDNTDLNFESNPSVKAFLTQYADEHGCKLTFYRDFVPTCLFVNEGAILEMPSPA